MTKRLIRGMEITVIIAIIIGAVTVMVSVASFATKIYRDILFTEASHFGDVVLTYGVDYLKSVDKDDRHVVWLDASGQVLYDSQAGSAAGEDYSQRSEVTRAASKGKGTSNYGQDVFKGLTVSSAIKLADDSIMLVSAKSTTFTQVVMGIGGGVAAMLIIAVIITAVAATLMSRSLVASLNKLGTVKQNEELAEDFKPLLDRLGGGKTPGSQGTEATPGQSQP